LAAKDFTGAVANFTAAIECYPFHSPSYLNRAEAKLALGDTGGASKDYQDARDYAEIDAERKLAEQRLRALQPGGK
jgi:tetratricopeptide (TPR) repeat protein